MARLWRRLSLAQKSGLILAALNLLVTGLLAVTLHAYSGGDRIMAIVFAFGILAMVPIVWFARRVVGQPLRQIAEASRAIAAGDLSREVPLREAEDEIGQLSRDFNAMTAQLRATHAELEAANARLLDASAARGQLIERLMDVQEDERGRIARELHDEVSQSLTSLLVGLQVLEKVARGELLPAQLADLKALASRMIDHVRLLSVELRPKILDELGLIPALRAYARDYQARHGVVVSFDIEGVDGRLPARVELIMYRVVQEALSNTASYARASSVTITFRRQAGELLIEVRDDGIGFDLQQVASLNKRPHLGIMGMQERAALVNGRLVIDTAAGRGTTVSISIPLIPAP